MTEGDKRRKAIFDRFANNLSLLIKEGIITIDLIHEHTYICPICKRQFSVDALDQRSVNPLTLEDAPPKSLGGNASILTCKSCNNFCGQKIDYHLTERMRELDNTKFLPGSEFNAKFERDGLIVQGTILVEEDGTINAIHKNKRNHPSKLESFIKSLMPNKVINISFLKTPVDPFKLQLALLKTGFLLTFSKYGYSFILNERYDRIRQQLLHPDQQVYPTEFWFQAPFPAEIRGVPFVTEKGLEAVMPIFLLVTSYTMRPFATIIPLTNKPIEETIVSLKNRFQTEKQFAVAMDAMSGTDYLSDVEAIKQMMSWIGNLPM